MLCALAESVKGVSRVLAPALASKKEMKRDPNRVRRRRIRTHSTEPVGWFGAQRDQAESQSGKLSEGECSKVTENIIAVVTQCTPNRYLGAQKSMNVQVETIRARFGHCVIGERSRCRDEKGGQLSFLCSCRKESIEYGVTAITWSAKRRSSIYIKAKIEPGFLNQNGGDG